MRESIPDLSEYREIFIDFCLFENRIPEGILQQMDQDRVRTSYDIIWEMEAIQEVLPPAEKNILTWNQQALAARGLLPGRNQCSGSETVEQIRARDNRDTGSMLAHISKECAAQGHPRRYLLMTGNRLLLQQVILADFHRNFQIDLYNLNTLELVSWTRFPEQRKKLEPSADSNQKVEIPKQMYLQAEQTLYFRNEGRTCPVQVVMTEMYGHEATMYAVKGHPKLLAKILNPANITRGKLRNIQYLIDLHLSVDWAMMPLAMLYGDRECRIPVGYLEKKLENVCQLSTLSLYVDPTAPDFDGKRTILYNTNHCLSLVRQAMYLRAKGVILTDFTLTNFSESLCDFGVNGPKLYIWDCDSFSSRHYYSRSRSSLLFPSRQYPETHQASIEEGAELLYQCVFRMLTLGWSPYYELPREVPRGYRRQYIFAENERNLHPQGWRTYLLYEPVEAFLPEVFNYNLPFSVPLLMVKLFQSVMRFAILSKDNAEWLSYDQIIQMARDSAAPRTGAARAWQCPSNPVCRLDCSSQAETEIFLHPAKQAPEPTAVRNKIELPPDCVWNTGETAAPKFRSPERPDFSDMSEYEQQKAWEDNLCERIGDQESAKQLSGILRNPSERPTKKPAEVPESDSRKDSLQPRYAPVHPQMRPQKAGSDQAQFVKMPERKYLPPEQNEKTSPQMDQTGAEYLGRKSVFGISVILMIVLIIVLIIANVIKYNA